MIEFADVSYHYAGGTAGIPAVSNLTMSLAPGETLVVLGPNGSGKTTIALLADGLLTPRAGEVSVDGMSTSDPAQLIRIRERVGVVFQNPDDQIVGTVVEEDVAFGPENLGMPQGELRERVDHALERVGLKGFERREPHLLSGGQKQRLAIAGALAMDPAYLILDEPTAMLDPTGRAEVLRVVGDLKCAGHGILHITHHVADALQADRAIVLSEGRIAFEGTPGELLSDIDRLAAFGLSVPPMARLAARLRELEAPLPIGTLTPDAVVEALWP